jgi:hypothetical protein
VFLKRGSHLPVPGSQQSATVAGAASNGMALIFATATEGTHLNYSRLLPSIWCVLCFAGSCVFAASPSNRKLHLRITFYPEDITTVSWLMPQIGRETCTTWCYKTVLHSWRNNTQKSRIKPTDFLYIITVYVRNSPCVNVIYCLPKHLKIKMCGTYGCEHQCLRPTRL